MVNASASSFIYVHLDRYLMVYNWCLELEERIDLMSCWTSTNIMEMGIALAITDVHGNLH